MEMNSIIINEELVERQKVKFIIDTSEDYVEVEQFELKQYPKTFVFIDSIIFNEYHNFVKYLLSLHQNVLITKISSNESIKNIFNYPDYIEILTNGKCSKKDLIIAIGGGVILDFVGFLSSTYMRGISLIMVPTTLIGMADASTAGKTCMNMDTSKNLLGSFYLPKIVYNNIRFLKTCTEHSLRQGISEIFKYGLLGSRDLIDLLLQKRNLTNDVYISEILMIVIGIRFNIRKINPLASNLGHTFGHALEKYSNFNVAHGDAISIGVVMALMFSLEEGLISDRVFNNIYSWMRIIGLNTYLDPKINPEDIAAIMSKDKKSFDDNIGLVLIKDVANPILINGSPFYFVKENKISNFIKRFINNKKFIKDNCWELLSANEH